MRTTWYGFLPQSWWCRSHFTCSRDHHINYTWAQTLFASYSKFVHQTPTRTLNILYVFVVSVKDMMAVMQITYQNVCGSIIYEVTFGRLKALSFAPQAGRLNIPTTGGYATHCRSWRSLRSLGFINASSNLPLDFKGVYCTVFPGASMTAWTKSSFISRDYWERWKQIFCKRRQR